MFDRWNDRLKAYPRLAAGMLVLVTFAAYGGSLSNTFVYDDEYQVIQNPFVVNPHLWRHIFSGSVWSFRGGTGDNFYRPLQMFVYWILYRLGGPNPAVFHLAQVLWCALTVWLVYRLGVRLLKSSLAAFAGALIWALHPLHAEAVAWIAGWPDVGFTLFYLLAFLLFLRAEAADRVSVRTRVAPAEAVDPGLRGGDIVGFTAFNNNAVIPAPRSFPAAAGNPEGRVESTSSHTDSERQQLARHAVAALVYLPALFFKEMAVSLPLLIVVCWAFRFAHPSGDSWRRSLARRAVRLAPYLVAVVVYLAARESVLGHLVRGQSLAKVSPHVVAAAIALLGENTRLFFWPAHLSAFRTFDLALGLRSPWPWLTLVAISVAIVVRRRRPLLSFLVLWWPVTLLPCLDIRQLSNPLVADRFSYLPSVGLCLAISWLVLVELPERMPRARPHRLATAVLAGVAGLAAVALVWGARTVEAAGEWRDNETLIHYSLVQSPGAAPLHIVEGWILEYQKGDLGGADREFKTALRLNQASVRPMLNVAYDATIGLGQVAYHRGDRAEAVRKLNEAIRLMPNETEAYQILGSLYIPGGDYSRAAAAFTEAVRRDPQNVAARFMLGTCWMKLRRYRDAAEQFRAAASTDPTFWPAYEAEARALEAAGDSEGAAQARARASTR